MTIKKIILIVILLTVAVMGIVFWVQKTNKEKLALAEKEKKTQEENKKGVIYKLAENGCKLGIVSIDGENLNKDFYKVCPNKIVVNVNKQSCNFAKCISESIHNTTDWKMYKNDKYKFSIKYPNNWEVGVMDSEVGAKKIEVVFGNKKCLGDGFEKCADDFSGYRIIFYQNTIEQIKADNNNVEYYKKGANRTSELKLFSGENISLYIEDEFNEKNFKENMDLILPGAQAILNKNEYSVYFIGDFRGNVDTLGYLEAALATMGFD